VNFNFSFSFDFLGSRYLFWLFNFRAVERLIYYITDLTVELTSWGEGVMGKSQAMSMWRQQGLSPDSRQRCSQGRPSSMIQTMPSSRSISSNPAIATRTCVSTKSSRQEACCKRAVLGSRRMLAGCRKGLSTAARHQPKRIPRLRPPGTIDPVSTTAVPSYISQPTLTFSSSLLLVRSPLHPWRSTRLGLIPPPADAQTPSTPGVPLSHHRYR
jgi:hypothetical protein